MAMKFEDVINGMINVSFGAAAVAAEKGRDVLGDLSAKGAEARRDAQSDFARSVSDAFEAAGGKVSDVTDRLSAQGAPMAEKVLDELIRLRAIQLSAAERDAFAAHVAEVIRCAKDEPVKVEVESVEEAAGQDADKAE